jgi:hypothetical protein
LDITPETPTTPFHIPSGGNAYLALWASVAVPGILNVTINIIDNPRYSYPIIHLFVVEGTTPSAFPRDYDGPDWGEGNYTIGFVGHGGGTPIASVMIHNPLWWTAEYSVVTQWTSTATPVQSDTPIPTTNSSSEASKTGLIIGLSVGGVVLIVAGVLVGRFLILRKRRQKFIESDSRSEQLLATSLAKPYV